MSDLFTRFMAKVRKADSGCWEWTAGKRGLRGYGSFRLDGRMQAAHRVSMRLHGKEIPAGLVVDHICRNPACVNPGHLRAVDQRTNVHENSEAPGRLNALKTHCPQGHAYEGANLYVAPDGQRKCRECKRIANRARRAKEAKEMSDDQTPALRASAPIAGAASAEQLHVIECVDSWLRSFSLQTYSHLRNALNDVLDAYHAGRLVADCEASEGYVSSIIDSGEEALARGIDSPEGVETGTGSTAKPQEPGPEGTRPEQGQSASPEPREPVAPAAIPDSLCQRLQQQCSDWGVYWRAPDSHGVDLTLEQAEELLRNALCVEVAIKGLSPHAYADGFREAAMEWRPFGLTAEAALNRGDDPAMLFDENSPIRDELRRLLARGMEARSGETEGLDPEGATARSATPTRPEAVSQGIPQGVEARQKLVNNFARACIYGSDEERAAAGDALVAALSVRAAPAQPVAAPKIDHVECENCGAYFYCHRCDTKVPEIVSTEK
jgi:hypothetical protein